MAQRAVTLPDGRRLSYVVRGAASGAPILFFAGAATSTALPFATEEAEARGARVIAFDRPGIGGSTHDPARTLASGAADVDALVGALGLSEVRLAAFSQGAPFALACADRPWVARVALMSGTDELTTAALAPQLPPDLAGFVRGIAEAPEAVEAELARTTADAMLALIAGTAGPEDRAVYDAPDFAARLRRAVTEGLADGRGYARDTRLAMSPWGLDLARVHAPIDVFYGALDASPVHSPDHGASLVGRLRDGRRHVLEGVGGALPFVAADRVLDALLG